MVNLKVARITHLQEMPAVLCFHIPTLLSTLEVICFHKRESLFLIGCSFCWDLRFQLGKCVRVFMLHLLLQSTPLLRLAGRQVRRSGRPHSLAHHALHRNTRASVLRDVRDAAASCQEKQLRRPSLASWA